MIRKRFDEALDNAKKTVRHISITDFHRIDSENLMLVGIAVENVEISPAYANINGSLVLVCNHEPKCLALVRDPPISIESVNCIL